MKSQLNAAVRAASARGLARIGKPARSQIWVGLLAVALLLSAGLSRGLAQEAQDGPRFEVSQILLDFAPDLPVHPPARRLMELEITLGVTDEGFVAPRDGVEERVVTIAEVPQLEQNAFHSSALAAIGERIANHFAEWGYSGIIVEPHEDEVQDGQDVRPDGHTAMRMVVTTDGEWEGESGQPDEVNNQPSYEITQFVVSFDRDIPRRPPLAEVMRYELDLGQVSEGFVGPRPGIRTVRLRLADVGQLAQPDFYPSAIRTVTSRLEQHLADRGFEGLRVVPHPEDMNADGEDLRFDNQTALRLRVELAPEEEAEPEMVETTEPPEPVAEPDPVPTVEATEEDGRAYPISQLILEYAEEHAAHPPLRPVMEQVEVRLAETEDGYVAAREDGEGQWVALSEIPLLPKENIYGSAIQAISREIVSHYGDRGYIGINVSPHPEDLNEQAADVRPEGVNALRMLVQIGRVTDVRTVASGDRVPDEQRINNPKHAELVSDSPVQPGETDDPEKNDLLRKDALDNYVAWLNRHPGRRVDVAVSPSGEPGGVALDLMVTENKPWLVYFQASNTGTEQTSKWRERFGFNHYQLTDNDDVLTLDYITASFDSAHTFLGSYEAPLFDVDRVRWRVHGNYSEFTASDVGFADEEFRGQEWSAGGDLIANIFQHQELFVDLMGGLEWQHNETDNEVVGTQGETDYFLPHVGLQMERFTEESNTSAELDLQFHPGGVADNDPQDVEFMGRLLPDDSFTRLTWRADHSFYLEPLLWRDKWLDPSTPESSTLAHELAFMFRGQYSPDRLVPQFQRTAGGLHSVRGYDESLVSGDSAILATAEYRFHLPRIFGVQPDPNELFGEPFRFSPQQAYGRPDWDLILRGFFDYGHTYNSDRLAVETNHQLMSTGVGAELLFKRNLNLRVDWGYVLDTVTTSGGADLAERGDSRVHFSATLLY